MGCYDKKDILNNNGEINQPDTSLLFLYSTRSNFFYIGVDNPVEIITNYPLNEIFITSDSTTIIEKASDNYFTVRVKRAGEEAQLRGK